MAANLPPTEDFDGDDEVSRALDIYYQRLAEGPVDRESFLAEFPHIAGELRSHFDVIDQLSELKASGVVDDAHSPPPLDTIRYFGNYELLEEIARGGMGVVYRARQVNLNRIVAVKMILAGQFASTEDITRFRHEAEAAAALHHPNIVTIFEVGEHEGQHFFSMEYVEGTDLAKLVRENPINPLQAAQYAQIIAEAIAVTHEAGVLHRDLKPSNILVEAGTGRLRITDFGLSKRLEAETLHTSTGRVLGTPSYMSPEQASGSSSQIGPATDIYSIGAVLYELVTARPPFVGETPWDIAFQVRQVDPIRPTTLNFRLPRDLETICLKCLQKDPDRRYATATDIAEDLGRFLRGEPIVARPVGRTERAWRWCRRNPALASAITAAAAGFLGLLITLTLFGWFQRENALALESALGATQEREREVKIGLAAAQRDRALQLCREGEPAQGALLLATSLETAPPDVTELRESIRFNLTAWKRELLEFRGTFPGEGVYLDISPTGDRFLTGDGEHALVRDIETGKPVSPPLPGAPFTRRPNFGTDGRTVFLAAKNGLWLEKDGQWDQHALDERFFNHLSHFFRNDNTLLIVDSVDRGNQIWDAVANKPVGQVLRREWGNAGFTAISLDAKYAATRTKRDQVQVWDLETGKAVGKPLNHPDLVAVAEFSPDSRTLLTTSKVKVTDYEYTPQAYLWEISTGERSGGPLSHYGEGGDIRGAAFSEDGERIFTRTHSSLRAWDRKGMSLCKPISTFGEVSRWNCSRDGGKAALCTFIQEGRVWDIDADRSVGQPVPETTHLVLSADGRHLLSSDGATARLWRVPTQGWAFPPLVHAGEDTEGVSSFFGRDGRTVVGYQSLSARIWSLDTGQQTGPTITTRLGITRCDLSPDGRYLAVASMQNFSTVGYEGVRLYDTSTGEKVARNLPKLTSHGQWVQFTSDGRRLIVMGDDGVFSVYDMDEDKVVVGPLKHPLPPIDGTRMTLALSPDDRTLATAVVFEGPAVLWDISEGKQICELPLEKRGQRGLTFTEDGKYLAIAANETAIWDVASRRRIPHERLTNQDSISVAFSPDGRLLATGHTDGSAQLWDVATGEPTGLPLEHSRQVYQVAFAAGGRLLVTSTPDGAQLWHCATGTRVGPLLAPSLLVAVSPGGSHLACSGKKELRISEIPAPSSDDPLAESALLHKLLGTTPDEAKSTSPAGPDP